MARAFKMDYAVAVYVLAALCFLIVPIQNSMLDWLIGFNMMVAFMVLFTAIFAKETLEMSSFPTLLLFTTVFRISLNVSSTRLILSTGQPGRVVETFGGFVGGGDVVIGIIVFIILIIVQMMLNIFQS